MSRFSDMKIEYRPIGVVHSPFKKRDGMPIQPAGASGIRGTVEIFSEYKDGLRDLEGFSHIFLIYHLHKSAGYSLRVIPFLDTVERGVFATRAPRRPNPIGLSVVRLVGREDAILHVENLDILDGTPLLDIKPYVSAFDVHPTERAGWIEKASEEARKARGDSRFT